MQARPCTYEHKTRHYEHRRICSTYVEAAMLLANSWGPPMHMQ